MPTDKPLVTLAREVLDLDRQATPEPWRYGALEHGGRCVTDGSGYLFAQVDDDGNGRLIAHTRTSAVRLAEALLDVAAILDSDVDVIEGIQALRHLLALDAPPVDTQESK